MNNKNLLYIFFFLLIAYLVINTGLVSDDFEAMTSSQSASFKNILIPHGNFYFIDVPVMHFTHYLWYHFFNILSAVAVNIVKIAYIILAFYMVAQFFKIYMDEALAILASFLFIFFPSHDSTVYMFMCQYLTLTFAFYLYAYYLAHNNKLTLAFLAALIASFISYGSTPLAIALFALFIMNKSYKKAAVIIIPNIIYAAYFITVTMFMKIGHPRTLEALSITAVMKQYILQILTFVDAVCGPQMWLKVYYSFSQLSLQSIVAGLIFSLICYKIIKGSAARYNLKLVISLFILVALSFGVFALTGRYPQLCFNLGNRVTIYGALLLTYLIVLVPAPKLVKYAIVILLIFTVLGISDHWKRWNVHQQKVICNMRDNKDLQAYNDKRVLYFAGNQYSKYGPMSHIEFLSEAWVPNCILKLMLGKTVVTSPISRRFKYENGCLVDTKYNSSSEVDRYINIYDSERNELFQVDAEYINGYIDTLPLDKRHWVQVIGNARVRDIALKLMPRLRYAF
ncbi:MAG: hypothetical protein WC779_00130 [Candidatus Omnitrophota bacterium]|jgi:hypothetical protein